MSSDNRARPLYPPGYAFVVHFWEDVSIAMGRCGGRVEHVVSGRVEHFSCWENVLVFMARVLNEIDDDSAHDRLA